MKICFRCKVKIRDNDNYFKMIEVNNNKEIHTDHVHKVCWNSFIKQLDGASNSLNKSNYLLNALGNYMKKAGILPKEEYVV